MANHAIKVNIAANSLKQIRKTLGEIRRETTALTDAIDRLAGRLQNYQQQMKVLRSSLPRSVNVGVRQSTSKRQTKDPVTTDFPSVTWRKGPVPPVIAPPKIADLIQEQLDKARQQAQNGQFNKAGMSYLKALSFKSGAVGKMASAYAAIAPVMQAARLLIGPLGFAAGAVTAFAKGLYEAVTDLNAFSGAMLKRAASNYGGDPTLTGRAGAFGSRLGLSPDEVSSDAMMFNGGAKAFYKALSVLNSLKGQQAAEYAKALGLEKYLGVSTMGRKEFSNALNTRENAPDGTGYGAQTLADTLNELRIVWEAIKTDLVTLAGILSANLGGLLKMYTFFRNLQGGIIRNVLDRLSGGSKVVDKQMEAAEKQIKAADTQLRAAGTYGGGSNTRNAFKGAYISPAGDNYSQLRAQLRALGTL